MSRPAENDRALSELIESIVNTPASAPADPGAEAREFPRFPFRGRAQGRSFSLPKEARSRRRAR